MKRLSVPEAIFRGNASIVACLLVARIDVNSPNKGNTALTAAIQAGNKELLRYLLNKGVDINNLYTKQ
jgi:ankyrin repeat protein